MIRLGFAMCGSFCTFEAALRAMERCRDDGYDIVPIFSENAASIDTRFGKAADFIKRAEEICSKQVIKTISDAEPIGPQSLTDIMLIAPCTGNTAAKITNAITDTTVTMAVKSHLRGGKPVVVAISTNDALRGSNVNIAALLNRKNYYFVPMRQDNPAGKPTSLAADFELIPQTLKMALEGKQLQPVMLAPKL